MNEKLKKVMRRAIIIGVIVGVSGFVLAITGIILSETLSSPIIMILPGFFMAFFAVPIVSLIIHLARIKYGTDETSTKLREMYNGKADSKACPHCGDENVASSKFCKSCGKPLYPICPHCGGTILDGAKFCGSCGKVIDDKNDKDD